MGLNNKNIQGADELVAKLQAAKTYIRRDVFTVIGVEAVNLFKGNFQKEGFLDKTVTKWQTRKTKRTGGTNSQKTLSKSGELADSIDFKIKGYTVTIYSDKVYAQIHNEGGKIEVTQEMKKYFWAMYYNAKETNNTDQADQYKAMALSKIIVMPKRSFMGNSETLNTNIIAKVSRDLNRILS
jgi:phage gpG-like protein